MARRKVTLSLEEDLMRRMKSTSALLDTNVSTVVEELMRIWLEAHENRPHVPHFVEDIKASLGKEVRPSNDEG